MDELIAPPITDPNFLGYFKFNETRFGIFFRYEQDKFLVYEMFLKTRVFEKDVEDIDQRIAGFLV